MLIASEADFVKTYVYPAFAERALEKCAHWFPIRGSPELAGVVADLLTDGHIQTRRQWNHKHYDYVSFFSEDDAELRCFNERVSSLFGVRGKIRKWGKRKKGSSKGVIISNAALARVLGLCGVACGNKVASGYEVPAWIRDGSSEIKRAFLMRSFTCEGCVCFDNSSKRGEVKYSMYKAEAKKDNLIKYLNQLKAMLAEQGILSSNIHKVERYERKDGTLVVGMRFRVNPASFSSFQEKIGFCIDYKNLLLQNAREWAREQGPLHP